MRVLTLTNMYPAPETPTDGVFIAEQIQSLRDRGVETRRLHVERATGGMRAYRTLASRTREAVAAFEPDVVHATYGGLLALLGRRGAPRTPFVVSFCGSDLLGESNSPAVARTAARVGVWASRRTAVRADAVVVKSENLRRSLPRQVVAGRVHLIPNGVDTALFAPMDRVRCRERLGWTGPGPHVVFAGRPRPIKRPELARAAVERLRDRHPAIELHVPEDVGRELMPTWLNAGDAVLLTSRHEGSPNIVKEALACETPIVAVPVGDVRERISGVRGCRVVGESVDDIAGGLGEILSAPQERSDRSAIADLTLDAVAGRVLGVYRSAITEHATASKGTDDASR